MSSTLVALFLLFGELSLLAFGGGNTILPEMHRQTVDVHHWLTNAEFTALFALAQAAPGPNMMIVPLIGLHVAGWAGLVVSAIGMFGPAAIVTAFTLRLWRRFKDRPWRQKIQAGIVPVSIGLVAAGALLIVQASDHEWVLGGVTVVVALLAIRTKVHPLWLLGLGAVVGWSGFGQ